MENIKTYESHKLPRSLVPKNYQLFLDVNFDQYSFTGRLKITLDTAEATNRIIFHSKELFYDDNSFNVSQKSKIEVLTIDHFLEQEMICLNLGENLQKGVETILQIKYTGYFREQLRGFYLSKCGKNQFVAVTQFQPCSCRRSLPSWDEPEFRAIFELTLCYDKKFDALSNTHIIENNIKNGKKETKFAPTPSMSCYLLAWVIGEWIKVEGTTKNGTKVAVYCDTYNVDLKKTKRQIEYVKNFMMKVLDYYDELFGIKYNSIMKKLDLVAIENFYFAAMENWGLITYKKKRLLVDEDSPRNKKYLSFKTVSHEIMHQWFGNLTTFTWWNELWLNEGFARFLENYAVDEFFPSWKMFEIFQRKVVNDAMTFDQKSKTHPVNVDVKYPAEILKIFDTITYSKGGAIIRQVVDFIGTKTFFEGIRNYLKKHKFKNTTATDLWKEMELASGKNVKEIMDGFINQKGYPIVSVLLVKENEKYFLKLKQQRFIEYGKVEKNTVKWNIPITIKIRNYKPFKVIMKDFEMKIEIEYKDTTENWIKINWGSKGFFRCFYGKILLKKLKHGLLRKEIPVLDRIQLLSDLYNIAMNTSFDFQLDDLFEIIECYNKIEEDSGEVKILVCDILDVIECITKVFMKKGNLLVPL